MEIPRLDRVFSPARCFGPDDDLPPLGRPPEDDAEKAPCEPPQLELLTTTAAARSVAHRCGVSSSSRRL